MIVRNVARRYATALFQLGVEQDALGRYEGDLTRVLETVESEVVIRRTIYHPLISVTDKRALVEEMFKGKVTPPVLNFLGLLLEKKRERFLPAIIEAFQGMRNAHENIADITAEVAMPLAEDVSSGLHRKLGRMTGKKVNLRTVVNRELIGGMTLHIGDKRYDGSVRGRLENLRRSIGTAAMKMSTGRN